MKANFFIVVAFLAFISCKKENTNEENNKPVVKENFSMEIDVVVSKRDDFTLYFTEDNTVAFTGGNTKWVGVNGGNIDEKLLFELSTEKQPTNIRLDFGLNKLQDSVLIKNIKLVFYGKEIAIKGSQFFDWFIKDENFKYEIDEVNGTIKFVKTGNDWVTPYYYPRQEFTDRIKILTIAE
ncbi:hypothetical protein [Flavobacterium sp.]|uniref:hypothetical protein n=1 Tax=Flavobacterium sp. TaxID=239 RepID=UPI004047C68E